jgi:hypothetical protein
MERPLAQAERDCTDSLEKWLDSAGGTSLVRGALHPSKRNQAQTIFRLSIMKQKKKPAHKFAVCVNNADYPVALELHKIFRVLPDVDATEDGDIRVIDESGEDYLYPAEYFVFVDLPQAVEKSMLRAA